MFLALIAAPASVAAILMKPNFIRYFILSAATGFVFALVAIDLPSFYRQFHDIVATPRSIWSWVIWFVAFFISSASTTLLLEVSIGGFKMMLKKNTE